MRTMMSRIARSIWRHLPLSAINKWHIKTGCFRIAPWAFRWSSPYQEWKAIERELGPGLGAALSDGIDPPEPMAITHAGPVDTASVRLIAFYLPQFHPTLENDEWWGRGFTEWGNVVRAKPQFTGHYQPHLPGELGFYDLRVVDVQRRQVELARLYGIGGFCFYFYWFGGKRLLEKPIRQYVDNKDLDLPFCICWANENWSRRWDGRSDQILISQQHSAEDDLAFIAYLAAYLRDHRYIRIDRRPLLIVYRPDLLPSARETAERWRHWCSANGIGEIFLAYTQSFKSIEPQVYGFDAAIEFPPNNSDAPNITHKVELLNSRFRGVVYDWRVFARRSRMFAAPQYPLFRTVCPSWDNEARRKGMGTVYFNSSPEDYEEWLFNACNETLERIADDDQRLVFVNAWNEWAEGAHLEPDARYGYAYLAATRRGIQAASSRDLRRWVARKAPSEKAGQSSKDVPGESRFISVAQRTDAPREPGIHGKSHPGPGLTVILHAFYPDLLPEMLEYLQYWEIGFRLRITVPPEKLDTVTRIVKAAPFESCRDLKILECTNRGRDILPYLKALTRIEPSANEVILKLHTKKTLHRKDGDDWRKELYEELIAHKNLSSILQAFDSDSDLGLVAAGGHLVRLEYHWGNNEEIVNALCDRMGLVYPRARGEYFPGGSMFFARSWAVSPIVDLGLSDSDFPPEIDQKDGTTAHAIERLFGTVCHAQGGTITDTGLLRNGTADAPPTVYRYAESDRLTRKLDKLRPRARST